MTSTPHLFRATKGFNSLADRLKRYSVGEALTGVVGLDHCVMNKSGLMIAYEVRRPPEGRPAIGVVVLAHGLNEHMGRYAHVARAMTEAGLCCYLVDHQGHGRTEGRRLDVHHFHDFTEDLLLIVRLAKRENPDLASKVFVLGHSMGGAIAIDAVLTAPGEFRGAVFSSPASELHPRTMTPAKFALVKVLGRVAPHLGVGDLDVSTLCRDEGVLTAYHNDPLIQHGRRLPARLVAELLSFLDTVPKRAGDISLPYLLIHGTASTPRRCPRTRSSCAWRAATTSS